MPALPPQIGWTPAGPGRIDPVPGIPPIEDSKQINIWRCTTGDLWAEEGRSPPMPLGALKGLALFLASNGYILAMINPVPSETVLLSRHPRLLYQVLPLPAAPKADWMLSQPRK